MGNRRPVTEAHATNVLIAAGAYVVGASAFTPTPATTPGLYVQISADAGVTDQDVFPVDALVNANGTISAVISLLAADLPHPAGVSVLLPTDVTGVIGVKPFVAQLASSSP